MKRRLIIMRHAKSDWKAGARTDHERPLNHRGRRDAPHLGKLIAARGYTPAAVISSDSARTTETWNRMKPAFPPELEAQFTRQLYLEGIEAIREVVEVLPDDTTSCLVLGHNPDFSMAVIGLAGEYVELKTAYAAVLECETETWAEAMKLARWDMVDLLTPHTEL